MQIRNCAASAEFCRKCFGNFQGKEKYHSQEIGCGILYLILIFYYNYRNDITCGCMTSYPVSKNILHTAQANRHVTNRY